MIHSLKILPKYFNAVVSGQKTFEIRFNDREFQKGDYLALNEWEPTSFVGGHYTGRSGMVYVDYILYGAKGYPGLDEDYVIMAIKPCAVCKIAESYYVDGSKHHANEVPVIFDKPNLIDKESENESIRTDE